MGAAASISDTYAEVIMKAETDSEKLELFNKIQKEIRDKESAAQKIQARVRGNATRTVRVKQNAAAQRIQARVRGNNSRTIANKDDDLCTVFAKFSNFGKSKKQIKDGSSIDGTRFRKMLKNSGLLSKKKFNRTSCDILFKKFAPKKSLTFEDFISKVIPEIAKAWGIDEKEVEEKIRHGECRNSGTKAEYSKFYDNKDTWTGVATRGGPSTNDNVITLSKMMDRSSADVRGIGANSGR